MVPDNMEPTYIIMSTLARFIGNEGADGRLRDQSAQRLVRRSTSSMA